MGSRWGAGEQRILALSSMVLPALALGLLWPGAFLVALDYSGTLRLLLFAVLPVLMVWRLRYRHHLEPWLPGGRPLGGHARRGRGRHRPRATRQAGHRLQRRAGCWLQSRHRRRRSPAPLLLLGRRSLSKSERKLQYSNIQRCSTITQPPK